MLRPENAWKCHTFTVLAFLEVKKWFQSQINLKTIPNYYIKKKFRAFQPRLKNLKSQFFVYKIYAVHQQSLKVLEGLDQR